MLQTDADDEFIRYIPASFREARDELELVTFSEAVRRNSTQNRERIFNCVDPALPGPVTERLIRDSRALKYGLLRGNPLDLENTIRFFLPGSALLKCALTRPDANPGKAKFEELRKIGSAILVGAIQQVQELSEKFPPTLSGSKELERLPGSRVLLNLARALSLEQYLRAGSRFEGKADNFLNRYLVASLQALVGAMHEELRHDNSVDICKLWVSAFIDHLPGSQPLKSLEDFTKSKFRSELEFLQSRDSGSGAIPIYDGILVCRGRRIAEGFGFSETQSINDAAAKALVYLRCSAHGAELLADIRKEAEQTVPPAPCLAERSFRRKRSFHTPSWKNPRHHGKQMGPSWTSGNRAKIKS